MAAVKPAPDLTSFYAAFTPLCFTLLGLWLVVIQTRHSEWRRSSAHRSRAYALSMNFSLPGMMGLLSLVQPGDQTLWRSAFACVAIAGVAILAWMVLRGTAHRRVATVSVITSWVAILLYALVALVAIVPRVIGDLGIRLTALEVEEIILSLLVFMAVNVAWFLIFEEAMLEEQEEGAAAEGAPVDAIG